MYKIKNNSENKPIRSLPMKIEKPISLDQFEIIRTIGVGAFSHADLALYKPKQIYCILKTMSKKRILDLNQEEHVQNEKRLLALLQHPNVVKLYGSFQDPGHLYLVTEFLSGGEVFSHLRTMGHFPLDVVRFYAAEILLVLQHLHSNHVVFRDLKPENLVFDQNGHITFIDFGFAKQIETHAYTLCGTPDYIPPEIIRGEGSTFASDWWSFGVIIYEFLVGETPFYDENENTMYLKICRGKVHYPSYIDPITKSLLSGLLQVDRFKRLGGTTIDAEEIKEHQWFRGVNWDKVHDHKYQCPLIPVFNGPGDSSNFADYSNPDDIADVLDAPPVDVIFPDW